MVIAFRTTNCTVLQTILFFRAQLASAILLAQQTFEFQKLFSDLNRDGKTHFASKKQNT